MDGAGNSPKATKSGNWRNIFLYLSERYGWTPDTISDMSLQQIWEYMSIARNKAGSESEPEQKFESSEDRIRAFHGDAGKETSPEQFMSMMQRKQMRGMT